MSHHLLLHPQTNSSSSAAAQLPSSLLGSSTLGCVDLQGEHPGYLAKSDIKHLERADRMAVLLNNMPGVDELLKTMKFKEQLPGLLKYVSCRAACIHVPFLAAFMHWLACGL